MKGNESTLEASQPGSLPCPMFPQNCQCAHVPLSTIQRALLHPDNRGDDGADEDVDSPGLSPHKVFLLARRRRAEAQMYGAGEGGGKAGGTSGSDGTNGSASLRGSMLVRTATEMRHVSTTNPIAAALAAGYGGSGSNVLAVLADRRDEVAQLRAELQARPVTDVIPKLSLRVCCLCEHAFAVFEGAQCLQSKQEHFLCNVCFGGYLMRACAPGGCYEQELRNEENMVVSPPGKLPCPFFRGHYPLEQQLFRAPDRLSRFSSLPSMDCQCGAINLSVIEHALLDPRNSSVAFWRERQADTVVDSHRGLARTNSGNLLARGGSGGRLVGAWANELLSRNFTPANVHETARLRVSLMKNKEETQRALTPSSLDVGADALADLHTRVIDALDRGSKMSCPKCGVQCVKNDACIHMDTCPCGSSWCFLCGKPSGTGEGQCPRGTGCDAQSCYLENHTGWGNFGINGETAAQGAQKEFLRRRQAYLVRKLKEETDPTLWQRLRDESPKLLKDVPTDGRDIDWDTLDTAEFPLFGSNVGRVNAAEVVAAMPADADFAMDVAAARRMEQHFADELARARREARRERMERIRKFVFILILLPLIVSGLVLLSVYFPQPDPLTFVDPPAQQYVPPPNMSDVNCTINSVWRLRHANITYPNGTMCAPPPAPPIEASFCWDLLHQGCPDTKCKVIFWVPTVSIAVVMLASLLYMIRPDSDLSCGDCVVGGVLIVVLAAICIWPLIVGPFGHWSYTLVAGPICSGAIAPAAALLAVAIALGADPDEAEDLLTFICGAVVAAYVTVLVLTIQVRVPVEIVGPAPADGCIHMDTSIAHTLAEEADKDASLLSVYTCTPACEAFRWTIMGVCATSIIGAVALLWNNRDEARCYWLITVPMLLALVTTITAWPLLLSAQTLASSGVWLYMCIGPCVAVPWLCGCGAIYTSCRNTLRRRCTWLDIALVELLVGPAIIMAGPVLSWMLLHIFRSSPPEESFIDPPLWASIYQWEGVVILAIAVILAPFIFDDEDAEDAAFAAVVFLVLWGFLMFFTVSSFAYNVGCFIFVSCFWLAPFVGISAALLDVADECDCCGPVGKPLAGFAAFLLAAGVLTIMIVVYVTDDYIDPSDTSMLPTAFAVQGASQTAANGLYIVRNDLSAAACTQEDQEGIRDQEFCKACSDGGAAADKFYQLVPGCATQSCVLGRAEGLVLYQVMGSTMWVVALAERAIERCGRDPSSVMHSPMVACYSSPSGEGCSSKWREAVAGGNDTIAWVDAPSLSVTDSVAPASARWPSRPSVLLACILWSLYIA